MYPCNRPWRPRVRGRGIALFSVISALDLAGWSTPRPGRFIPGIHCTDDWVDLGASLDGSGKSCTRRGSNPGLSNPYWVAIPTTLSQPAQWSLYRIKWIQSTPSYAVSFRYILILYSNLSPVLPSDFPSRFPNKALHAFLFRSIQI
jgi:hypothetical protein